MKNKVYKVTYTDLIEAESEAAAYASLLNYLGSVVEYADVEAFEFEEVVPPTEPAVLEIALQAHFAHEGLIDEPVEPPCPHCGREEDGKWFTPCPSDDCPSHNSPVPPCPEGVPYDNHLVDCNCD